MLFTLFALCVYKLYDSNFEVSKIVLSGLIGLVTLIIAMILFKAQKNYNKYKKDSNLIDWYLERHRDAKPLYYKSETFDNR